MQDGINLSEVVMAFQLVAASFETNVEQSKLPRHVINFFDVFRPKNFKIKFMGPAILYNARGKAVLEDRKD